MVTRFLSQDNVDRRVYESLRRGDQEAASRLVETFGNRVYGLCLRILGSEQDAREVVQETFLMIWRKWPSFRGRAKFSSWVYRVAANQAYMRLRRTRRHAENISLDQAREADSGSARHFADQALAAALVGQPVPPDEELERRELGALIMAAIDSLSPTYRTAYILRDVDGLPLKEIAAIMGLSEGAAKSRIHRARLQVRSRLAPHVRR